MLLQIQTEHNQHDSFLDRKRRLSIYKELSNLNATVGQGRDKLCALIGFSRLSNVLKWYRNKNGKIKLKLKIELLENKKQR